MIIALDFDGTYTEDPELWNTVVTHMQHRGYEVFCVTMRYDNEFEAPVVRNCLEHIVNRIIFTGRKAKEKFLDELGIKVNVWIDDRPYYVYIDGSSPVANIPQRILKDRETYTG